MFGKWWRRRRTVADGARLRVAVVLAGVAIPVVVLAASASGAASAPRTSFYANFDGIALIDQDGRPFRMASLDGKLAVFNFVYTGCSSTCPVQTRALVQVQQALPPTLRRTVRFVSVSIDPLSDTPAVLKAYATRQGVDLSDWSFATGRPQDIERVADGLRLFRDDRQAVRPDDHATGIWVVDGTGRLMQRYPGNPPDVDRLVRELRQLHDASPDVARAAGSRS